MAVAFGRAERRVDPTPETRRKLKADVIGSLLARQRLDLRYAQAAEEIRTVLEAVGRGMFATAQSTAWTGRAPKHRTYHDFISRMSAHERRLWERHYLPWSHDLSVEIAAGLQGTRWLQLMLDVVVDNISLRAAETRYGLAHGGAFGYLLEGLERYHDHRHCGRAAPVSGSA